MKRPNFFIVGASRSGTSSMAHYLRQHPEIFMPQENEMTFFGSDLIFRKRNPYRKRNRYFASFQNSNKKIAGEKSTRYLYSKKAAFEIHKLIPNSKIIIMLRNPVDMMYSMHSMAVSFGWENIIDFKDAIEAETKRKKGKLIPEDVYVINDLFYFENSLYYDQVKRYIDVFGKNNVKIIIFDDFIKETRKIFKETCEFLGVGNNFVPDFKIINQNRKVRFGFLRDFVMNDFKIKQYVRKIIPTEIRDKITTTLWGLSFVKENRLNMNPKLRKELQIKLKPDIKKLERLIRVDLNAWRKN